jgi:pantoate--beta-alanine ligase
MREIAGIDEMRAACAGVRVAGERLAFVPTMGFLHEGHLRLARVARERAPHMAMSIFVNPLQFAPGEDFEQYPRDPARDCALAESAGVDFLWMPSREAMYPEPPRVTVAPGPMGDVFEGAARPGHFAGVLTVVLKLFEVVRPHVAVFGRKDVQQAALVRRMVADFGLGVEIVVAPTVREADGLALSSRNVYLDAAARGHATLLSRALAAGVERFRWGERRGAGVAAAARAVLDAEPAIATDYVACIDPETFGAAADATGACVLAIAARIGGTRLIDNVVLGEGLEADVRAGG